MSPRITCLLCLGIACLAPVSASAQEDEVRAAAEHFVSALNDLDWAAIEASFDPAATLFHPQEQMRSRIEGRVVIVESFREVFRGVPENLSGPPYLSIAPLDLHVDMLDGNAAVATFHLRVGELLGRRTLVFVRRGDRWLISHLHASMLGPS